MLAPADVWTSIPGFTEEPCVKARDDRFIGGAVAPSYKSIVLYRGNLERLVVAATFFKARPGGPSLACQPRRSARTEREVCFRSPTS
jgi:hypothetical protein